MATERERPICKTSARIAYAVSEFLEETRDGFTGELSFDPGDNESIAELMVVVDRARRGLSWKNADGI